MAFIIHLCTVLLAASFLGQCAQGLKHKKIREQGRFKRLFSSKQGVTYIIEVTTGSRPGAGTDANVAIVIQGSKATSPKTKLSNFLENNFEAGKTDTFKVKLPDLGEIKKITISHDNFGILPAWNLVNVKITAPDGKQYKFPCNQCVLKKGALSKELLPEGQNPKPIQVVGGCEGIFADTSHCWPFNDGNANQSPDLKGGFPAMLKDGARIADSVSRGKVASTLEQGSWIDMGNFQGKCISDPSLCVSGITMMFWASIDMSPVMKNPSLPKYVFSSGGSDSRSRGFSFFHQNNMYVLQVVNGEQKWRVEIPNSKIPFNSWFSFAFTWDKGSGLTHFINGREDSQSVGQPAIVAVPHKDDFNDLRISKPNSNNNMEEMLPMKFDQLVTWGRILLSHEITQAFNEGGGLSSYEGNVVNLQVCQPNPCLNGGTCKIDVDEPKGYRCICTPQYAGLMCEIKEEGPTNVPTTRAPTTAAPTTVAATTGVPTTLASTTLATTTSAPTTLAPTTLAASTSAPSTGGPSTAATGSTVGPSTQAAAPTTQGATTIAGSTAAATTAAPTSGGTTTAAGSTGGPTTGVPTTGAATPTPSPVPDVKQLVLSLIAQINIFRRFHQASDVTPSEKLNQLASQWAQKIAAAGVEKIDPNSTYGQLVCSHNTGGNIAKACAVKWYGAMKFFDWADPKLTMKASPFTQMVWKSNSAAGVGVAKGGGGIKKQNVGGKYYVVVLFDPGQSEDANIKDNVLPAAGISEPAPEASCPEGYSKLPQGSRSCFSVNPTPLTWDDALYGCALDNGTLASLQCREEADLIVSLLKQSNTSEAWIGLHDRSKEGRYVWVDGSTIPFSEWLQGEPNGDTSENCIVQAKGNYTQGWADRHCFERKAFVCEVPVPGYTTYKLTFNLTEPQSQSYQNNIYSQYGYPGSYSMCTPYVQTGNDLLRETITRYFQAKNIAVQPIVNTIRCMPNGLSVVEVILRLGPEAGSDYINSLQTSIKGNDGELELSNGASAKLISVEILSPGVSYCPSQCASTSCQPGCDQSCCTPTYAQYRSPMAYQQGYQQGSFYTDTNAWQCPYACTNNVNYCPPYCSPRCCNKRRSRVRIHKF